MQSSSKKNKDNKIKDSRGRFKPRTQVTTTKKPNNNSNKNNSQITR